MCPAYDTKQFDGEAPVMLELRGMRSAPSLSSLPDPRWPGVVVTDRVLSMGQIELFDIHNVQLCKTELFEMELLDYLTVCKQMIGV